MITKAGKKRAGYPMDFIPDKELFKAVMFARQMIKQGTRVDIACYRATEKMRRKEQCSEKNKMTR